MESDPFFKQRVHGLHDQKFSARKETEPPNPSHGKAGCAECKGGWARGSRPPGAAVQVTRTVRAAGTGAQRRRREPDPRTSGCQLPSRPSACPAAPPRVPSRLRERRRPLPGARPLESRLGSPRSARAGHPPGPRAGTPARRPSPHSPAGGAGSSQKDAARQGGGCWLHPVPPGLGLGLACRPPTRAAPPPTPAAGGSLRWASRQPRCSRLFYGAIVTRLRGHKGQSQLRSGSLSSALAPHLRRGSPVPRAVVPGHPSPGP